MSDLAKRLTALCERHRLAMPGPWLVCTDAPNDAWFVGMTIHVEEPDARRIGDACDWGLLQTKANADLMAAGPELLATLRETAAELSRLTAEVEALKRTLRERRHPATKPRDPPEVLRTVGFWPECGCGECYAIHCLDMQMNEVERLRAELRECNCPRPINTATDESTAWCVDNGYCGCGRNVLLGVEKGYGYAAIKEATNG